MILFLHIKHLHLLDLRKSYTTLKNFNFILQTGLTGYAEDLD